MKILFIGIGPWNDIQSGNNILTNWFTGFPCEAAQIYVHTGLPCNKICTRYFHITDDMMVKSMVGTRAGKSFEMSEAEQLEMQEKNGLIIKESAMTAHAKAMPRNLAKIITDFFWVFGRVNKKEMETFVKEFNPDIVFCPHLFDFRFWRIERMVHQITSAPFVAFTGDSEVSLNKVSYSPLFWIRQITLNLIFRKHIKLFKHYFTFSEEQAQRYHEISGIPTSTLYKCADLTEQFDPKPIGKPIRLVYAGNIIYNRWETLSVLADAIEVINEAGEKMVLDIYTNTKLTPKMAKRLENRRGTIVHGRVTPTELIEIYKKADIALHIESFTKKYRLDTKDSFSTKIVDLMNSTCAIMAVCWEYHNGQQYLQREDAAICISDLNKVQDVLQGVCDNPSKIQSYARKAWECGKRNHTREVIQNQITEVFEKVTRDV